MRQSGSFERVILQPVIAELVGFIRLEDQNAMIGGNTDKYARNRMHPLHESHSPAPRHFA